MAFGFIRWMRCRARQRGWIEFSTATLADAWHFLNATDRVTAGTKQAAFRERLQRPEAVLVAGPCFSPTGFGMVDAAFAPVVRYFDILESGVSRPIFEGLPRVSAWRGALSARQSVMAAGAGDDAKRFRQHLREQ